MQMLALLKTPEEPTRHALSLDIRVRRNPKLLPLQNV
jgi:hypothetical protein